MIQETVSASVIPAHKLPEDLKNHPTVVPKAILGELWPLKHRHPVCSRIQKKKNLIHYTVISTL